jgi:hypothetical protein
MPSDTLGERIGNLFRGPDYSQFAKLDPGQSIAVVWPEPPPNGDLHVFVTVPGRLGSAGELTAHDAGMDFFF